jgi:hypothetical protein
MTRHLTSIAIVLMAAGLTAQQSAPQRPAPARRPAASAEATTIDVTVREGTSMSVAISPDGRTLATDMQGSIWTVPVAGGAMKRITDVFNDARQPMWSPDGRTIAFFAYRDGGYDLWAINPTDRISASSPPAPTTIASRPSRTTARGSRSRRIAATRSAATTTSGRSICATAS